MRAILGEIRLFQAGLTWFDEIETELGIVMSNKDGSELLLEKTQGINYVLGK